MAPKLSLGQRSTNSWFRPWMREPLLIRCGFCVCKYMMLHRCFLDNRRKSILDTNLLYCTSTIVTIHIFSTYVHVYPVCCSSGCYQIKISGVSMTTLNRLKYLNLFSACQTFKIYELLVFFPLSHLSQSKCAHKVVVTRWLTVLLFALLGYFSPVVISRPRGELQLQSGNMDFSFLLLWRRKRSGDARGSRLLSKL